MSSLRSELTQFLQDYVSLCRYQCKQLHPGDYCIMCKRAHDLMHRGLGATESTLRKIKRKNLRSIAAGTHCTPEGSDGKDLG